MGVIKIVANFLLGYGRQERHIVESRPSDELRDGVFMWHGSYFLARGFSVVDKDEFT